MLWAPQKAQRYEEVGLFAEMEGGWGHGAAEPRVEAMCGASVLLEQTKCWSSSPAPLYPKHGQTLLLEPFLVLHTVWPKPRHALTATYASESIPSCPEFLENDTNDGSN